MGSKISLTIDGTEYELLPIGKILPESECSIFLDGHWYAKKAIQKETKPIQDWEIVSFKSENFVTYTLNEDKTYSGLYPHHKYDLNEFSKDDLNIQSVLRISDNEVFQIGDEICHRVHDTRPFVITSFYITDKNEMGCMGKASFASVNYFIENWVKVKPKPKVPLFTTEDGVEIFTDTDLFLTIVDKCFHSWPCNVATASGDKNLKYFADKEKAKEYIVEHKSFDVKYNEVRNYMATKPWVNSVVYESRLKDFFKSKINP